MAKFFHRGDSVNPVVTRIDRNIDFLWGWGRPDPAVNPDDFTARWTGWLTPPVPGDYVMTTIADDAARVWLDDNLVVNDWTQSFPHRKSATIRLDAKRYAIRVEYGENNLSALMSLRWRCPGVDREETIPPTAFAHDPNSQVVTRKPGGGSPTAATSPAASDPPLRAIAPFEEATAKQHQATWARHLELPVVQTNSIGMKLTLGPPGEFLMGSPDEQIDAARKVAAKDGFNQDDQDRIRDYESPQHRVVVPKPFLMGSTEVTVMRSIRLYSAG